MAIKASKTKRGKVTWSIHAPVKKVTWKARAPAKPTPPVTWKAKAPKTVTWKQHAPAPRVTWKDRATPAKHPIPPPAEPIPHPARVRWKDEEGRPHRTLWRCVEEGALVVVWHKRWDARRDSKTCGLCREMHGQTVAVDAPFRGGAMSPPLHRRCRCTLCCIPIWTEAATAAEE